MKILKKFKDHGFDLSEGPTQFVKGGRTGSGGDGSDGDGGSTGNSRR